MRSSLSSARAGGAGCATARVAVLAKALGEALDLRRLRSSFARLLVIPLPDDLLVILWWHDLLAAAVDRHRV
jgi:hypothetical protein